MERDPLLDYATPEQPPKGPYWTILFAAWILSLPVANSLDQELKRRLYGGYADGGATMLAMLAIVPAVGIAAFVKRRWWTAAIIGGLCSPLAVVAVYLVL